MALLGWQVAYGGRTPPPGAVGRPDERLCWPREAGGTAIIIDEPGAYREP
jgi:hypothetical protein